MFIIYQHPVYICITEARENLGKLLGLGQMNLRNNIRRASNFISDDKDLYAPLFSYTHTTKALYMGITSHKTPIYSKRKIQIAQPLVGVICSSLFISQSLVSAKHGQVLP